MPTLNDTDIELDIEEPFMEEGSVSVSRDGKVLCEISNEYEDAEAVTLIRQIVDGEVRNEFDFVDGELRHGTDESMAEAFEDFGMMSEIIGFLKEKIGGESASLQAKHMKAASQSGELSKRHEGVWIASNMLSLEIGGVMGDAMTSPYKEELQDAMTAPTMDMWSVIAVSDNVGKKISVDLESGEVEVSDEAAKMVK